LADEQALREFIRKACVGVWHPGCTCRMGGDNDATAVTDPEGRVRGVQGLRVVDASIFPALPSGNINFPTMMVAERIADLMVVEKATGVAAPMTVKPAQETVLTDSGEGEDAGVP